MVSTQNDILVEFIKFSYMFKKKNSMKKDRRAGFDHPGEG